jgi:hypothetical protein
VKKYSGEIMFLFLHACFEDKGKGMLERARKLKIETGINVQNSAF